MVDYRVPGYGEAVEWDYPPADEEPWMDIPIPADLYTTASPDPLAPPTATLGGPKSGPVTRARIGQTASGLFTGPNSFVSSMWESAKALPQTIYDAVDQPAAALRGRGLLSEHPGEPVDPTSDEGIQRASDAAGTVTLGGGALPIVAPARTLRSGMPIRDRYPVNRKDKAVIVNGKLYQDETEHVNALEEAAREAGYSSLDEAIEVDPMFENLDASAFGEIDKEGRFVPYEPTDEKPLGSATYEDYLAERDNQKYWDENGDDELSANRSSTAGTAVLGNKAPTRPKLTPAIFGPDGNIYVGPNHGVVSDQLPPKVREYFWDNYNESLEGFVDENGRFLNRKEAKIYAKKHNLLPDGDTLTGSADLSSEDLIPRAPWERDLYDIDDDEGIYANRDKTTGATILFNPEEVRPGLKGVRVGDTVYTDPVMHADALERATKKLGYEPNLDRELDESSFGYIDEELDFDTNAPWFVKEKRKAMTDYQAGLQKKYGPTWPQRITPEERAEYGRLIDESKKPGWAGDPENTAYANRSVTGAIPLFSRMEREAAAIPQPKAQGAQWSATLKNRGVPGEEIEWTGVADWLKSRGTLPVTKEELLAQIGKAQTQVGVKRIGGERPDYSQGTIEERNAAMEAYTPAKFANYQLPGGENYREVLLTLPPSGKTTKQSWKIDEEGDTAVVDASQDFRSSHWDEPNVLAHMRVNDRYLNDKLDTQLIGTAERKMAEANLGMTLGNKLTDGPKIVAAVERGIISPEEATQVSRYWGIKNEYNPDGRNRGGDRVLFAEEIQSDWHQKGRREGYSPVSPSEFKFVSVKPWGGDENLYTFTAPDGNGYQQNALTQETAARMVAEQYSRNRAMVPNAPFKKTWPDLVLKRLVADAIEGGYDAIAWTDGATQNARYQLSSHIKQLQVQRTPDGQFIIEGTPLNGDRGVRHGPVEAKQLPDIIGKEMADRILRDYEINAPSEYGGDMPMLYEGVDLEIGGEGMRAFYDQELPRRAKKLFGKWGAVVEDRSLGEGGPTVHTLPITQEMRTAIQSEGLPLFANKSKAVGIFALGGDRKGRRSPYRIEQVSDQMYTITDDQGQSPNWSKPFYFNVDEARADFRKAGVRPASNPKTMTMAQYHRLQNMRDDEIQFGPNTSEEYKTLSQMEPPPGAGSKEFDRLVEGLKLTPEDEQLLEAWSYESPDVFRKSPENAQRLEEMIDRNPLPEDIVIWRGNSGDLYQRFLDRANGYLNGPFLPGTYLSGSMDKGIAYRYTKINEDDYNRGGYIEIHLKKGSRALLVPSNTHSEVIISRNQPLRVKNRSYGPDGIQGIVLESTDAPARPPLPRYLFTNRSKAVGAMAVVEGSDPIVTAFHGTQKTTRDLIRREGFRIPEGTDERAIFLASDPLESYNFAWSYGPASATRKDAKVMRTNLDTSGFKEIDYGGETYDPDAMVELIDQATEEGLPGLIIRNIRNEDDRDPTTTYAVLDKDRITPGKTGGRFKRGGRVPNTKAELSQYLKRRAEGGGVSIEVNGRTYTGPKSSFRGRPLSQNIEDRRASERDKVNVSKKGDRLPSALETLIAPPEDLYLSAPHGDEDEFRTDSTITEGIPPSIEEIILRQAGDQFTSGLVEDPTPGRTDRLPTSMPADSYVIPADIVSGMGQGNTLAGAKILDAMFRSHGGATTKAGGGSVASNRVPVIVAGGEYVVPPDRVRSIGGGDPTKGHKNLDSFVKKHRVGLVKRLKSLDPPRVD